MRVNRRSILKLTGLTAAVAATSANPLFGQLANAGNRRGIALTIGLNRVDPVHYGGAMPLRGCVNDAKDVHAIARASRFECFNPLLDDTATRAEVITSIEKTASELNAGDTFLVHYSGHGASIADRNADEPDGRDETWCLFDGMMIDDELNLLWAKFKPGVRILVLSDSCHSGTVTRGQAFQAAMVKGDVGGGRGKRGILEAVKEEDLRFRFIPDDVADDTVARNKAYYKKVFEDSAKGDDERDESAVKASVLLISGCQDNQLSGDLPNNGVFTSAVKTVWDNGHFKRSWRAFHAAVVRIMPATQTPNFYPTGVLDPAFWSSPVFTI